MPLSAFTPAQTISLTASAASSGASFVSGGNPTMEINNAGTVPVFIRFGVGAQTAVATDYPVLPGHCKLVNKANATHVAAICPAGSAVVYFTDGSGDV